jgi:hypothetical protein
MNVYEKILADAERTTAQRWQQHEPLTYEQLDGLAVILETEQRGGSGRRTVPTNANSRSEWITVYPVNRPTMIAAMRNIIKLMMVGSSQTVFRDPFSGVVWSYRPAAPDFRTVSGERSCSKCGHWKLRTDFYRDKSRPDGLDPYCKPCRSLVNADQYKRRAA